jgi:membrane associated rhomboid family serine protease
MVWGIAQDFFNDYSFNWLSFQASPWSEAPKLVTYVFLHADTAHIVGNLLFFFLFAPAVERAMGSLAFAVSYLLWGAVAALTQALFEPFSRGLIGASGAISGASGAYFVLFPLRVPPAFVGRTLGRVIGRIPAFFLIGLWFVFQLRSGFAAVAPAMADQVTLVAHWAHVGGFTAGAISAFMVSRWNRTSESVA